MYFRGVFFTYQTSITEFTHRAHLLGKRHWANQRLKDEALKTVYIRGFPPNTTELNIRTVFSSFGTIHKVMLDSKV